MVIGFWKRLLSDFIDVVILGVFGFLIAFVFKPLIFHLGENGLWIGLSITFLYTGILQSYIGQGQSLGKRILKIQVLRTDGSYLSLPRSFVRYAIIAFICYNSWIIMALSSVIPFLNNPVFMWIIPMSVIIVFLGCSIFLALHPLKKGLQDILVDSIVVAKDSYSSEKLNELDSPAKVKRAYAIWGLCCLLVFVGFYFFMGKMSTMQPMFNELMGLRQKILTEQNFSNVTISKNWNKYTNKAGQWETTTTLFVSGFLKKSASEGKNFGLEEAKKCAKLVSSYSKISEINYILVQVRTGFNIGIASGYFSYRYPFTNTGEYIVESPQR